MNNITLNLPPQFRIRPTIPFSFFDAEFGDTKHLRMVVESYYDVISGDNGRYLIKFTSTKPIHTIIKGFISEQDLIDGIIKGKLVIV